MEYPHTSTVDKGTKLSIKTEILKNGSNAWKLCGCGHTSMNIEIFSIIRHNNTVKSNFNLAAQLSVNKLLLIMYHTAPRAALLEN